jgi:DNA-binding NarL/FixJ family response regulator
LGGAGFYSKAKPPEGLIDIVCQVGQGNSIFPYEKHEAKTDLLLSSLTTRELEILEILSHGYSNRKIAGKLEISDNTVKFHLKNIYEKILVGNRTQLPGCSLRSEIRTLGLVGTANSRHQALIRARNQAAEAGATHLQLENAESNRVSTTLVGKALFCLADIALEDQDFDLDNLYILD